MLLGRSLRLALCCARARHRTGPIRARGGGPGSSEMTSKISVQACSYYSGCWGVVTPSGTTSRGPAATTYSPRPRRPARQRNGALNGDTLWHTRRTDTAEVSDAALDDLARRSFARSDRHRGPAQAP